MSEQKSGETLTTAQLDWSAFNAIPLQTANVVLAQGFGGFGDDQVLLSFGSAVPPIETAGMDHDTVVEYFKSNRISVQPTARIALPVYVARKLMLVLQRNLEAHEAMEGEKETAS